MNSQKRCSATCSTSRVSPFDPSFRLALFQAKRNLRRAPGIESGRCNQIGDFCRNSLHFTPGREPQRRAKRLIWLTIPCAL